MTNQELLNLNVESSGHDDGLTIKGYFKLLLTELWREGESFSGKRPFGDSRWEYDLYKPLIKAGAVNGELDLDGYIVECDNKAADKLVFELIADCFA